MRLRDKLVLDYYLGSLLHVVLKPPTILLGRFLRRNHDLGAPTDITLVKMLGGGSLVIAYPALLALRRAPQLRRMRLVTTPAVRPFAEALGVFDEIIVIRDDAIGRALGDSIRALRRLFRTDAIVDLEIHSRLTTVFSLLTCARNRVGFYTSSSFWRQRISTHLLFCNPSNGIYDCYDQIARCFGTTLPPLSVCRETFRAQIGAPAHNQPSTGLRLALAPCCSDLSPERMLQSREWLGLLDRRLATDSGLPGEVVIDLFGAARDRDDLEQLRTLIRQRFPLAAVENHAGRLALADSVRRLAGCHELISIDSALLHFARLLGLRTVSYWGPTQPDSLLRPWPGADETIHYQKLSCSPCVHLTQQPPCGGNNLCMRLAFDPSCSAERNPVWPITGQKVRRFFRSSAP